MKKNIGLPKLRSGTGKTPGDGGCIMQVADYLWSGGWTDNPECVHPVLRSMAIRVNDGLDDEGRQELWPLINRLMGTAIVDDKKSREIGIRLAVFCAEKTLPIFEKKFPNDNRPRKAIEAVKNYLHNGEGVELKASAAASSASAASYASAAASYASDAAAAASSASDASDAAAAASYASDASDAAAASSSYASASAYAASASAYAASASASAASYASASAASYASAASDAAAASSASASDAYAAASASAYAASAKAKIDKLNLLISVLDHYDEITDRNLSKGPTEEQVDKIKEMMTIK